MRGKSIVLTAVALAGVGLLAGCCGSESEQLQAQNQSLTQQLNALRETAAKSEEANKALDDKIKDLNDKLDRCRSELVAGGQPAGQPDAAGQLGAAGRAGAGNQTGSGPAVSRNRVGAVNRGATGNRAGAGGQSGQASQSSEATAAAPPR